MDDYEAYLNLACAIVERACEDYKEDCKTINRMKPKTEKFIKKIKDEYAQLWLTYYQVGRNTFEYFKQFDKYEKAKRQFIKLEKAEFDKDDIALSFNRGFLGDLVKLMGVKLSGDEIIKELEKQAEIKRKGA